MAGLIGHHTLVGLFGIKRRSLLSVALTRVRMALFVPYFLQVSRVRCGWENTADDSIAEFGKTPGKKEKSKRSQTLGS